MPTAPRSNTQARVAAAVALAAGVAMPAATARAQTSVWDNEKGDYLWFEAMNWDPDGVPTGGDAIAEADDIIVAASQFVDVNSLFSTGPGLRLTGLARLRVASLSEIVGLIVDTCCITDITADGPLLITGPSEFNSPIVFNGSSTVAVESGVFNEGFFADTEVEITGDVTLDPRAGAPGGGALARSADVTVTGTLHLRPGSAVSSGLFPNRWNLEGAFVLDGTGASVPDVVVDATIITPGGTVRARNGRMFFRGSYNYSATTIAETGGEIVLEGNAGNLGGPTFRGEGTARIKASMSSFRTLTNEMNGPGGLIIESPNLELTGNIVSSGTLALGNTTISGPGNLVIAGGTARTVAGGPTLPRTELSGGTFEIDRVTRFNTEFVISGGTLDLKPGAALGDPADGFPVKLTAGAITMAASIPATTITDINTALEVSGGLLLLEGGRQFRLRRGSTWAGGEVNFGTSDDGSLYLGGFLPHTFNGGTTIGGRGILDLGGPTSGERPDITLNGNLALSIGGPDDRAVFARVRTRLLGAGQLTNAGYLRFEGVPRLEAEYVNAGLTTLSASLTVEKPLVNLGAWEHQNSLTVTGAPITNAGLWTATQGSINDAGFTGSFNNTGTYTVGGLPNFITHRIGTRFNNIGVLQATNAEVTVALTDQIDANGRLTGGNWSCGQNGRIRFQQNLTEFTGPQTSLTGSTTQMPETRQANRIADGATRTLTGDSTLSPSGGKLTVDDATLEAESGAITVPELELKNGGKLRVAPDANVDSTGPVRIGEPPAMPGDSVIDQIEGVIDLARPAGRTQNPAPPTVAASLIDLYGQLVPGGDGTIGDLLLEAPLTAHPSATWRFDTDANAADLVTITGPATLAGTLIITAAAPLATGDTFVLIDAPAGLTGDFDAIEFDADPSPGQRLLVTRTATRVTLTATCTADLAPPLGDLTFADISAFLSAFAAMDPAADLADPPAHFTFADITAFLAAFAAGCP